MDDFRWVILLCIWVFISLMIKANVLDKAKALGECLSSIQSVLTYRGLKGELELVVLVAFID